MTTGAEHCRSYYAATVNDDTRYPALAGRHTADICVVGAGFTGLAAALPLAERGYSVVVVEAKRVGWGASGRNGGQLIAGIPGEQRLAAVLGVDSADVLWELRWRGHPLIAERIRRHSIECDLTWGYVDVAVKPAHMKVLHADLENLQRRNFPHEVRLLEREAVRELIGSRRYVGGLLNMGNGHLHPLNLCLGEARAARSLGVRIFENSPVVRIEHGARPRVHTQAGEVDAETVILAGGAYHDLEREHLDGLTLPFGSYILATKPLPEDLARAINPRDLAVCDANNVLDYYRMSPDRRLLFGGRCNYSGRETQSMKPVLLPRMLKIYPQLRDVAIGYEWGGRIDLVPNRAPLLGRIGANIYYAQGYTGHGVNTSHIAGEILADAIDGSLARLDVFERVHHWRLPFSRWLGRQAVSLGLMYYRLRDLL
jgi:glycine/D-amino acid oxidase-like deaminating enzyme